MGKFLFEFRLLERVDGYSRLVVPHVPHSRDSIDSRKCACRFQHRCSFDTMRERGIEIVGATFLAPKSSERANIGVRDASAVIRVNWIWQWSQHFVVVKCTRQS